MSRPVRERIEELELDVQHVRLAPAAAVRARGSSRKRRRLAGTTMAVAALVAAAGFGVAAVVTQPTTSGDRTILPAAPTPCALVDARLPDGPEDVEVQVFAGAATTARAASVADELGDRRFPATAVPGTDPAAGTAGTVAVLRYGPSAVGAAALVRSLVGGNAVMKFDATRPGQAVDLVLGPSFQRLASTTEMNQALVAAGEPTVPPQCRSTPGR
jgi:hypothetical protein